VNQGSNNQQDTIKLTGFFRTIRKSPGRAIRLRMFFATFLCVGTIATVTVLSASSAQARVNEDAIFEMSLGGGFALPVGDFSNYWDTLGARNGFELDFSGGYFLTANLSLGLAVEYAQFSVNNPLNLQKLQKYRLYTLGAYGKYFTGLDSKISPYLRVQGGLTIPNFSAPLERIPGKAFRESQFEVGFDGLIGLGARISTSDWGGIFLEAAYRYTKVNGNTSTFEGELLTLPADVTHIQITAGIGFDFGPKQ